MKRLLSMVCALVILLLTFAAALPTAAAVGGDWKKLTYTLEPQAEGESAVTADIKVDVQIPRSCTINCDPEKTELRVNGKTVESGHRLEMAGEYELTAVSKANTEQMVTYAVTVLPDINLSAGQVFTSYPTITCTNALEVKYYRNQAIPTVFQSGTTVSELGAHTILVYGRDAAGNRIEFPEYRFYIKACHAERVFDQASGKEALNITVGTFEDRTVSAVLDGETELSAGSNIVTKVGAHKLDIKVNGEKLTLDLAQPSSEQLTLRVELYVDALESKDPFLFDFSRWDAEILLDGEHVTGSVRVGDHGDHTITVRGSDGQAIENALSVTVGERGTPTSMTELSFTFNNPHMIYAIIVAVPALALLIAACYFLVARRRIV
ncbi:MAG: hypothetical protein IJX39_09625 [Clostridia bacterium]|nr:hypothetical protein [Clostridia bacterium]